MVRKRESGKRDSQRNQITRGAGVSHKKDSPNDFTFLHHKRNNQACDIGCTTHTVNVVFLLPACKIWMVNMEILMADHLQRGYRRRKTTMITSCNHSKNIICGSCLMKNHQEKQVTENLLRGALLKRALVYLESSLLGRLYSELQSAHKNKALHKALEQECSDLESLVEEIRETI